MENASQLTLGALVALLILREVFAFLKKRGNQDRDSGWMSPDFWRATNKEVALEALTATVLPILDKQTDILGRLEQFHSQTHERLINHGYMLEDIKQSVGLLRQSNHTIADTVQKLVNHAEIDKRERGR